MSSKAGLTLCDLVQRLLEPGSVRTDHLVPLVQLALEGGNVLLPPLSEPSGTNLVPAQTPSDRERGQ
jgi:hypothetical protein